MGNDLPQCNWCHKSYRDEKANGFTNLGSRCIDTFDKFFGISTESSVEKQILTIICNFDPQTEYVDVAKFKEERLSDSAEEKANKAAKLEEFAVIHSLSASLMEKKEAYSNFKTNKHLEDKKNSLASFETNFFFPVVQYKVKPEDELPKYRLVKGSKSKGPFATGLLTPCNNQHWGYIIGLESKSDGYRLFGGGAGDVQMKPSGAGGSYVSVLKAKYVEELEKRNVAIKKGEAFLGTILLTLTVPVKADTFFSATGESPSVWKTFLNSNNNWQMQRRLIIV